MENKDIKREVELFYEDLSNQLNTAALFGDLDTVKRLISKGAAVNSISRKYLYTALHSASNENHLDIVKYLLQRPEVDMNILNKIYNNYTPLNGAVFRGHINMVQFLIEEGADVNKAGDKGYLPLHSAAWKGNLELVKLLLEHGADINARSGPSWRWYTALEAALLTDEKRHEGHDAVAKFLIENGADGDVNKVYDKGYRPLHTAARRGNLELVQLLLKRGADINAMRGPRWMTALQAALQADEERHEGHDAVASFLITSGADVNKVFGEEYLPLYSAAYMGSLELVKLLLKHGADINAKSGPAKKKFTALEAALLTDDGHERHEGHDAVVQFLQEQLALSV